MYTSPPSEAAVQSIVATLIPVMTAVLAGFVMIGVALPVLPLHVIDDLGFGPFVVGVAAGAQFAASLFSRVWAGSYSDRRGAKRGVLVGLIAAAISGLLYLLSLAFVKEPTLSVAILLVGRAVLGGAESFLITGAIAWGLGLVDRQHAGKVIAWVGTAMFAAMALGGPVGTLLYTSLGFSAIALITALLPLMVLAYLVRMPAVGPHAHGEHASFNTITKAVWLPGLGAALASIGYCAILAFGSLFFTDMHWQPVWMAFTAFGVALIAARATAGHLPDRFGGARVAAIFVIVQATGLLLMWLAKTTLLASAGAALAGFGYSLVYPGLGVEAVRGITPKNRGMAMGVYTVFLDVAMAVGSPALGWVGGHAGLRAVFLVSAVLVACTAAVAVQLIRKHRVAA
ncbi:MFS transporter [Paraburkholderia rhynchosiae]|uniref:Arabinose transporter n=1 Tax=Paraburkholderia rhynchosiae TaxID=487049 RepID=A0A2N7VKA4_9BURK|nr:MFS transporter [Paraburkholderia rhynchosiae]PMS17589.1 arabinose transporter [Paraburkholderia rhynchosiae]CAB3744399.1 putative MFS-type transporter YfcJ [Paraburkholderia rhynchosiae]